MPQNDFEPSAVSERVCHRCSRTADAFFLWEDRPICSACCDAFTAEELLRFTGAASLCDLLYDLGYCEV